MIITITTYKRGNQRSEDVNNRKFDDDDDEIEK